MMASDLVWAVKNGDLDKVKEIGDQNVSVMHTETSKMTSRDTVLVSAVPG